MVDKTALFIGAAALLLGCSSEAGAGGDNPKAPLADAQVDSASDSPDAGADVTPDVSSEAAATGSLVWSESGAATAIDWRTLPVDVEITGVTFDYDLKKGGQVDYVVAAYRSPTVPVPYAAYTGGYAELVGLHPTYYGSDAHWHQHLDFSGTPLYLPSNTNIVCASSGGTVPETQGARGCTIDYRVWSPGDSRYRIFRIPYLDPSFNPGDGWVGSYYTPTTAHPLHVKGFMMYEGVIGTYKGCLQRINGINGDLIDEHCLPTGTRSLTTNVGTFGVEPVDWVLDNPDTLAANCAVSGTTLGWDCSFYSIVQIPDAVPVGPENAFRDYGNIPGVLLGNWCSNYIDNNSVASQRQQLCYNLNVAVGRGPATVCTRSELISSCEAAFPVAACVGDGGC